MTSDPWILGSSLSLDDCNEEELAFAAGRTVTTVHTTSYMAPEILLLFTNCNNQHLAQGSPPMDLWSLGVLIYKLLVGVEPYTRESVFSIQTKLEVYLKIFEFYHQAFRALFGTVNYDVCSGLLTQDTRSILQGLLGFRADSRLGYSSSNLQSAQAELMNHPFFATIDWVSLELRQVNPPYIPHAEYIKQDALLANQSHQTLTQILASRPGTQSWIEEFELQSNASIFHNLSYSSRISALNIDPTDQHYFRNWSYFTPSTS